ncbi:MAG: hypothetical protein IPO64_13700 [Bacteroidetes bacterium]|nr:hypothetical protein [Bacteroidota bacterium]
MLKYQVNDLRLFSENDVRFPKQFSGPQISFYTSLLSI